ncbi:DNA-directed RNA polymerase subunit RPC12/RpoP [Evansella vedderi]|uniref:DNA-directed RNA polymerase subunit RPC12/RpoP n=2 Tax=Evansella vedderi TaxID=38282 RepID=A0ABU0A1M4_9BACI|nr:DNA-directed RNA polymerase subunit RPC12/RpoP [Evansella vedderi]
MIKMPLKVPLIIKQLEALKQRLYQNHPKLPQIEYDLAKRWRGYRGEKAIQYYLKLIDDSDLYIFNNLRLKIKDTFFEIDTLILTSYYFLIFQVKNYRGEEISFENYFNQCTRTINGQRETIDDPLLQAKRHKILLINWLNKNKITMFIPMEEFVVISNSKCLITTSPNHPTARQKVIRPTGILSKVEWCNSKHMETKFSNKELRKLANSLLKNHVTELPNVLEYYQIPDEDIIKGISCPKCSFKPMVKIKGYWKCTNCSTLSKNAYLKGIKDYVYLYGQEITNKQLRDFFQISSRYVAKDILQENCVNSSGKNSQTIYILPLLE